MSEELTELQTLQKPKIILTCFLPYKGQPHNASEIILKRLLEKSGAHINEHQIIHHRCAVVYNEVKNDIQKLLQDHKPEIVIHIGEDPNIENLKQIKIEQYARKCGYAAEDNIGNMLENKEIEHGKQENFETKFDIKSIKNSVEQAINDIEVYVSKDAGNYLCEYIYYISLNEGYQHTLFIHVPTDNSNSETNEAYPVEKITDAIKHVIKCCIDQKNNNPVLSEGPDDIWTVIGNVFSSCKCKCE